MISKTKRIMIVAGEASGDLQGAALSAGLIKAMPDAEIIGVGGRRMRESGIHMIEDSSSWSAIGINEAIKLIPKLLASMKRIRSYIKKNPPDLLIPIDFGAFNVRLCKSLELSNIKILYYFPPGSWKRNADYSSIKGLADKIVTPYSWSCVGLNEQGISADFFGHPLLDITKPSSSKDAFLSRFNIDVDKRVIAILPGSRTHEIKYHIPIIIQAIDMINYRMPDLCFMLPLAPSIPMKLVIQTMRKTIGIKKVSQISSNCILLIFENKSELRIYITPGMTTDVLAHSEAAIITSGTATVEGAILGCPMVIIYKGTFLAKLEYNLRRMNIKYIGMPNIISDDEICKELIQDELTPQNLYDQIMPLISDSEIRQTMLSKLKEVKKMLGDEGAIMKTVDLCVKMLSV